MLDLLVLVADKDMEFALRGAFLRPERLGIRPIRFDMLSHPNHDGGVPSTGAQLLALKRRSARHALMLLDYEGCGSSLGSVDLQRSLDAQLEKTWGSMARSVVIDPELEA